MRMVQDKRYGGGFHGDRSQKVHHRLPWVRLDHRMGAGRVVLIFLACAAPDQEEANNGSQEQ